MDHFTAYIGNLSERLELGPQQILCALQSAVMHSNGLELEEPADLDNRERILNHSKLLKTSLPNLLDAQRHESSFLKLLLLELGCLVRLGVYEYLLAQLHK